MTDRPRAVAFDADPETLLTLRQALPDWEIEEVDGATAGSLIQDWDPGTAQLLLVRACVPDNGALGLCRGLRTQFGRMSAPLLVLVPPNEEMLVKAALEAGADCCLVLPVHVKDLVRMVSRTRVGNQPGRHTLNLDRAQREDDWRDDGGEA